MDFAQVFVLFSFHELDYRAVYRLDPLILRVYEDYLVLNRVCIRMATRSIIHAFLRRSKRPMLLLYLRESSIRRDIAPRRLKREVRILLLGGLEMLKLITGVEEVVQLLVAFVALTLLLAEFERVQIDVQVSHWCIGFS